MLRSRKKLSTLFLAVLGALALLWLGKIAAQPGAPRPPAPEKKNQPPEQLKQMPKELGGEIENASASLQTSVQEATLIDLASALNLAGVRNPRILQARERITEAAALRQLAAAQYLPTLHFGTSLNNHDGNLLTGGGNLLNTNRTSYYVGAGALAIAGGTVAIPGVSWNGNVSDTIYRSLESRQVLQQRQFGQRAVENAMLLRVALTYLQLVRAEARRAAAKQTLADADQVVRLTDAFSKVGQGRQSDADRARSERFEQEALLRLAEGNVTIASALLTELLNLPPNPRLHPLEQNAVPSPAVPDPITLPELLTTALANRPELAEQRSAIRQSMLEVERTRVLLFSPDIIFGLSYGGEGGGSDLSSQAAGTAPGAIGAARLSSLVQRADLDAVAYWSLQNLGVTNVAMIRASRSRLQSSNLELVRRLNDIQAEVAVAYARVHARLARIDACERAIKAIQVGFKEDKTMIQAGQGIPIELLNSLLLLGRSRQAYVDAIIDYNEAQMQLYVAIGQPPVNVLARTFPIVPTANPSK